MKKRTLYIFFLTMLTTVETAAQNGTPCAIEWKIAGAVPPAKEGQKPLGVAGAVAGIHNGMLIIAGGANFPDAMPWLGGKKNYDDEGFVFDLDQTGAATVVSTFKLQFPLAYSASCSTPGGIVTAGGENEQGISNKVFLLQWDIATGNILINNLPDLPVAVTNAAIASIDNKVYLAGGEMKTGVSDRVFVLDIMNRKAGWKTLPSVPHPVSHAVLVAKEDEQNLYLAGGRKKNGNGISDLYASTYTFDIKNGQWTEKNTLPYVLSAGTGVLAAGNSILLFGGDNGGTFHKVEELIAAIAGETDSLKKQELNVQKVKLLSAHPGFCKSVLSYDIAKDEWTTIGSIPLGVPVTTTAIRWNDHVIIPSGEIRAGVRTPTILLGKFCFEKTAASQEKKHKQ